MIMLSRALFVDYQSVIRMSCIDVNVFLLSVGVMGVKNENKLPFKLGCVLER